MGPWQNSHGSAYLYDVTTIIFDMLQWGHDKIVMEVYILIGISLYGLHASMGPWQNSHGSLNLILLSKFHGIASMGPWQNSHGSNEKGNRNFAQYMLQWGHDKIVMEVDSATCVSSAATWASMGPWQNSHGSLQVQLKTLARHQLQWGHDKIVMEVFKDLPIQQSDEPLQWGHDKIVMEVRLLRHTQHQYMLLQWGHDKIVMEVNIANQTGIYGINASMGPWQNSHGSQLQEVRS